MKFATFRPDKDREAYASDVKRLSAFYPRAAYDFYGTPSCALCVYKNGDAWPVNTGLEAQRIIREAHGVHDHPMQDAWPEVGKRVYSLLDQMKVRWTSIDPLAFAEAKKETFSPLLVWIGVEPESLTYELANTAAEAVSFFMTNAGFEGFEIGFRESMVTRSAHGPKMLPFDPFNDTIPEFRKPFTPTLGLPIASLKTPYVEGTGALYLRRRDSKSAFLLTCAHIARPSLTDPRSTSLTQKTKSHLGEKIVALGDSGYADALRSMMGSIASLDSSITHRKGILDLLGEPKEGDPDNITKKRNDNLAHVRNAKKVINEINNFHDKATKKWTVPDSRVIGEVFHVEPIALGVEPHGFTKDWALIELYNSKFDWDTFLGNKVYVGGNLSSMDDSVQTMFPWSEGGRATDYSYPTDGLLQVSGIIPAKDIRNPDQLDANDEKCLLVIKNGQATGTTVGRVSGMESYVREYDKHGIKGTSMEIAVLPYGNTNGPFSAHGDSGSIVLDRRGRILGMITGGGGTTDQTDVTYLTPYWWLEQQINACLPGFYLHEVVE